MEGGDARKILATAQLRRPAGEPDVPPVQPHQGLTARMALEGYTTLASAAAGEICGITVGAPADLTVFTVDPLTANPDELADAPIVMTMIGGDIVHRDVAVDR